MNKSDWTVKRLQVFGCFLFSLAHRNASRERSKSVLFTGEGNSPSASASSNNIDNKMVNKPKRNKTARHSSGLHKGLSTNTISTLHNKTYTNTNSASSRLVFSSASSAKKSVNDANSATILKASIEKDETLEHEQHQSNGIRLMSGTEKQNQDLKTLMTKSLTSLSTKLNDNAIQQVIRSDEQREQSPESIRMDGMKLKTFPHFGGEGPNLKLLSLQRNLITRLENIPSHLNFLVVLDLYDNRIERLTALTGFTSLRVLLLGKNRYPLFFVYHIFISFVLQNRGERAKRRF